MVSRVVKVSEVSEMERKGEREKKREKGNGDYTMFLGRKFFVRQVNLGEELAFSRKSSLGKETVVSVVVSILLVVLDDSVFWAPQFCRANNNLETPEEKRRRRRWLIYEPRPSQESVFGPRLSASCGWLWARGIVALAKGEEESVSQADVFLDLVAAGLTMLGRWWWWLCRMKEGAI